MWYLVGIAGELLFAWIAFRSLYTLHFDLFLLAWVLYALTRLDGAAHHGLRVVHWLRSSSIWDHLRPVIYYHVDEEVSAQMLTNSSRTYIFVVYPNATYMPLLWGFGLHGTSCWSFLQKRSVSWGIDGFILRFAFLRDFLLWSGAVAERSVTRLAEQGIHVAYCPHGRTKMTDQTKDHLQITLPTADVFEYAVTHSNRIGIVPVLVTGEMTRAYRPYLGCWWSRRSGSLNFHIWEPLRNVESADALRDEFKQAFMCMNETGLDGTLVFSSS